MNKIVKCPLIWGGGPHVNFTMKSIKRAIVFKKKVKKVQKRDFIKKKYCKDNNINLIEITYKDKNIYKVLNENLNNLKENIQLSLI